MKTRYPIEFKRGKLVKHLKPQRYVKYYDEHSMDVDDYMKLSHLVEWVKELGGEFENTSFEYEYGGYGDDGQMTLKLKINYSEKEIDDQHLAYEKQLSEWLEWKELSKTAKDSEDAKNKATRAKALKTQENNLLAKLRKIREQQDKI